MVVLFTGQVIFALMNNPYNMTTELWLENANAAIAAIRLEGADNLILISGFFFVIICFFFEKPSLWLSAINVVTEVNFFLRWVFLDQ